METRGQHDLANAVAAWSRSLRAGADMRSDDAEEICDHFRELVTARLQAGSTLAEACKSASKQMGRPDLLIAEMERARRPPHVWARWSKSLAVFGLVHSAGVLLMVALLAIAAHKIDLSAVPYAARSLVISAAAVLAGLGLVLTMVRQMGWFRGVFAVPHGVAGWAPVVYVVSLALVLLLAAVVIDYWQWWFVAVEAHRAFGPRLTPPAAVALISGVPIAGLLVAILLARKHPALQ